MRKNISSIRTKQKLADTLAELLAEKNIEKISIQDITDRCKINRQTFYYHFHDIYDLTTWMFQQKAESLFGCELDINNWNDCLLNTIHYIKENKKLVLGVINSTGYASVSHFIIEYIRPFIKNVILKNTSGQGIEEKNIDFLSNFCTISFSSLLIDWVITDRDEKESPEDLLNMIKITFKGFLNFTTNNYLNYQNR